MKGIMYLAGVLLMALQSAAIAQQAYLSHSYDNEVRANAASSDSAIPGDYWTPERLRDAKPITPYANIATVRKQKELIMRSSSDAEKAAEPRMTKARPPAVRIKPDVGDRLFVPDAEPQTTPRDDSKDLHSGEAYTDVTPQNVGTQRAPFTSSRLIPISADLQYPYRTVGKLFFSEPGGGDYVCSASVIKPRIILTAGHCVHSGSGGADGFYTNFLFVPAFRDGTSPYQIWNGVYAIAPIAWTAGGGRVPNAADYAVIELKDTIVGGAVRRIGAVTGTLGVQTLKLAPNQAHLLGYPVNLDYGLKMHQVTAASFGLGGNNTIIYGSDMGPGSSGGPWVENFQARAIGQTGGSNAGSNLVVGVTSYGAISPTPMIEGASILDARFNGILNTICAHRPGNCQ